VEASGLCVGEERVRPPDLVQHLIADAQFVVAVVEAQSLVEPVLPEVEIHREVLQRIAQMRE